MITAYQIIYWRDIPAQLKVRSGRQRISRSLSARFQEAIDEVAMRTHATATDDYLAMWRTSDWQDREGEPQAVADAVAGEIETAYSSARLEALIGNAGQEPSRPTPADTES